MIQRLLFEQWYASILFIFFQNFFKVGFAEVKLFPTFAVPNDTLGVTKKVNGEIAQLVEHRTENPCVGGSSPPFTTKNPLYATYEGFFIDRDNYPIFFLKL